MTEYERVAAYLRAADEGASTSVRHFPLGVAEGPGNCGMNSQRRVTNIVNGARQATGLGEYLVADSYRRFDPAGALAVFARRAHGALKRLFDAFSGHYDEAEIVE